MNNTKMALIYDFDKTLSPKDMQEFHYLKKIGYKDPKDFWLEAKLNSEANNMDGILSYMELMVKKNPSLTCDELIKEGSYIKLYKGVDTWFDRINEYGKANDIDVEHYIISSGIREMIMGTSIASKFDKVYACSFAYDEKGKVIWPSRVVNYTTKTQYLFRINKGILEETNDVDLNKKTPARQKHIPFKNMIYFGDGLTDVPSMRVMLEEGGTTVAVYGSLKVKGELSIKLQKDNRATYVIEADYSENSKAERLVKALIDSIKANIKLEALKISD